MKTRFLLPISVLLAAVLAIAACGGADDDEVAKPVPVAPTSAPVAQAEPAEEPAAVASASVTEADMVALSNTILAGISAGVPLQLPQAPASYAPKYGGSLDLVSNGSDFPRTFNMPIRAYNNGFVTHWGEQLTTFNGTIGNHPGDFGPRPWLAKSWEINDNGLTYIFHLEEGVRWASTPRVTVDETVDVTANDWVELTKLNFGLEESAYPSRFPEIDGPESFTALDDYTLQVKLNRNAASFLYKTRGLGPLLVGLQGYKQKMEAEGIDMAEAMQDWGMQVGTGPWIIKDFTPDVSIAFMKNPNYWGTDDEGNQLPFIDSIEIFKMADERAQDAGFRTGKIGALGIETCGINTQRYEAINKTNPDTIWEIFVDPSNARALKPNYSDPDSPWQDVRVRRAMQLAIDKEGWVESILGGWGIPFTTPLSPGNTFWLPPGQYGDVDGDGIPGERYLDYDVEGAKALMAEAGYADGFTAKFRLTHDQGNRFFSEGELLVASAAKIGITLEMDVADGPDYWDSLAEGDFDFYYTFPGFGFDPSDWLFKGYHSLPNQQFNGDASFQDLVLDALIEKEEAEADPIARYQGIADVQRYIQEQQFYIQGAKWIYIAAISPWLKNWQFHYSFHTGPSLARAWIEE